MTCRDCRFWKPDPPRTRAEALRGTCHLLPPPGASGDFPIVSHSDWCAQAQKADANGERRLKEPKR